MSQPPSDHLFADLPSPDQSADQPAVNAVQPRQPRSISQIFSRIDPRELNLVALDDIVIEYDDFGINLAENPFIRADQYKARAEQAQEHIHTLLGILAQFVLPETLDENAEKIGRKWSSRHWDVRPTRGISTPAGGERVGVEAGVWESDTSCLATTGPLDDPNCYEDAELIAGVPDDIRYLFAAYLYAETQATTLASKLIAAESAIRPSPRPDLLKRIHEPFSPKGNDDGTPEG